MVANNRSTGLSTDKDILIKKSILLRIGRAMNWFRYNLALIIPAIVVVVVLSCLHPSFLTVRNMTNILREVSVIGILAVGLCIVMASGKFDISFYGVGNFVMMTCAVLVSSYQLPFISVVLLGIAIGMAIGALNGFLVSILHLPDIMATIGVAGLFAGLSYMYTEGVFIWMYAFPRIIWLGTGKVGPITVPVFVLIAAVIIAYIFMYKLKHGLRLEAVGINPDAATHAGISTVKYRFLAFLLAGGFYGVAGVVYLGRMGKGLPTGFDALMLPVFAATFMGTAMFKGKANIIGTVVGAFILGSVMNGLTLLNIHWTRADLYRPVIFLIILIAAVSIRKRRVVG